MDAVRSQDVVVAAGLFALDDKPGAQAELARLLDLPRSRISESVRRLAENGLYSRSLRRLSHAQLLEFLTRGMRWLFPAEPGDVVQGIPTSHAGPVLNELIVSSHPYVWPAEGGPAEGRAVAPIHARVIDLALALPKAYELLSLADAMRVGRVRERHLASEALSGMLRP